MLRLGLVPGKITAIYGPFAVVRPVCLVLVFGEAGIKEIFISKSNMRDFSERDLTYFRKVILALSSTKLILSSSISPENVKMPLVVKKGD